MSSTRAGLGPAVNRQLVGAIVLALTALVLLVGEAGTASAATCADFPNQAAAQKAANTRDTDGDGIYCESLPCPCLKPGQGGGGGSRATPFRLGPSILFGPLTKRTGCHVRGPLPDAGCTPGARYKYATNARVCKAGYSQRVRHVTDAAKEAVYRAYGMMRHFNGRNGEVDHLVSLELGGSNVRANLFPEAASPTPGSQEKDRLENRLHREVCAGRLRLRIAQRLIAKNWVTAYDARFG